MLWIMDEIIELTKIDFTYVFIAVFLILIGIKMIISLFEWVVDKLGLETKWMRKQREEHDLLLQTSKSLADLQAQRLEDTRQSDEHDEQIRNELTSFIEEMKNSILETQKDIKLFADNRIHDREQSLKIQKELTDSIKSIVDRNTIKDEQMRNLMIAQREVLADKINDKYKYYISIDGIPEDEVDEFTSLHAAYNGVGGNHKGDAKYEYCINHLSIIPVEKKLIAKDDK